MGIPTRSDTNEDVQRPEIARGLKFRTLEVEGSYYPCSENKGADQLRSYREADLCLCFRICKSQFSHDKAQMANTVDLAHYEPSHMDLQCLQIQLLLCLVLNRLRLVMKYFFEHFLPMAD